MGTENSTIAVVQAALRHGASDGYAGEKSHRYGKSVTNQVIKEGIIMNAASIIDDYHTIAHRSTVV